MNADGLCMGCMAEKGESPRCRLCGWTEGAPQSALYLPPRTVLKEQYLLGRVLDYGGFGILYLGWDLVLARKLAVKEFLPAGVATRAAGEAQVTVVSGSPEDFQYGLDQFLHEGRVLARFQGHSNVVNVLNFFQDNGTAYLVMEFLDGVSLDKVLQQEGGRIPFEKASEILSPAMDALREVHREGLLHRDVSPDNVFCLSDGRIKLIDFGAARYALGQKSRNLSVILKEGYAPPEQYTSTGRQGPWTDVYGIAATFYRAITGQTPVPGLDRLEEDQLSPPSALGAAIPPRAEAALMRGLRTKAKDRFQSVEEFQQELGASGSAATDGPVLKTATGAHLLAEAAKLGRAALRFWRDLGKGRPEILWAKWIGVVAVVAVLGAFLLRSEAGDEGPFDGGRERAALGPDRPTDDKSDSRGDEKPPDPPDQGQQKQVPVPAISGVTPASASVGGPDLSLTVSGSNFQSDAAVVVDNRLLLQTRFVNAEQLTATLPASELGRPATVRIKVYNPIDGLKRGKNSASVDFPIRPSQSSGAARYQSLLEKARDRVAARDPRGALQLADEAIALDDGNPEAHDVQGVIYFYFLGDAGRARKSFQASLDRGGTATFRVLHDHSAMLFSDVCKGPFRIKRGEVEFESPAGHSFRLPKSRIQEVKRNKFSRFNPLGSKRDSFHVKSRDGSNYNLTGTSGAVGPEIDLILGLVDYGVTRK